MKTSVHHFSVGLYVLLFLGPLSILFFQRQEIIWPHISDVASILIYSGLQAALSAVGALFLGVGGAFGLASIRSPKWLAVAEAFAKVPAFLPPIFVIVAILNFVTPLFHFPYGLWGVVGVHIVMNTGYVATRVRRLFEDRVGSVAELAWLEGASRLSFFRAVFGVLRSDLALITFVIFCICLTSFAVPLTLGGAHGATLEVLVYERFRSGVGFGEALGYAVIQLGLLLALGTFLFRDLKVAHRQWQLRVPLLQSWWGLVPALLPTTILTFGLAWGLPEGITQLIHHWADLPIGAWLMGSLSVGVIVGCGVMGFLFLTIWLMPHAGLRAFLLGFGQPSTALFGLSLVLLGSSLPWMVFSKIILGLVLILTPIVFRWVLISPLFALEGQLTMAELMGASHTQTFRRILLPQLIGPLTQGAAFASVWAACDFSLSTFVADREWTLALGIDNLLSNYREELATGLLWFLFLVAAVCYGIFVGIGYGLDRKLNT